MPWRRRGEGRGSAICLRGPAGIGKTALLAAAEERASCRVLRCGGGRFERDHPYGAVLELAEPLLAGAGRAPFSWRPAGRR